MNTVTVLDQEESTIPHQPQEDEMFDSSDFTDVLVQTDAGTPLVGETMRNVDIELDSYLHQARTGIMADEIRFPWNKVFQATNQKINAPDKRKILSFVEKQLDGWLSSRPVGTSQVSLDPEFKEEAPDLLHTILKSAHNKMKLDGLVVAYCLKSDKELSDTNTDFVREQLRAYIRTDSAFYVSRGGMASVYRIKDAKGKATGLQVEESAPAARGSGGAADKKTFQRFTATVKEVVKSKANFERAKSDLKTSEPSVSQLREWMSEHTS